MSAVVIGLITINTLLFVALGVRAFLLGRRAESPYLRTLAWVVSAACMAFVLGALQRLAVQAVTAGWLPDVGLAEVTTSWQLFQSLLALSIAVAGFWVLSRTWGAMGRAEQVASTLAGRLPDVDLDNCDLTARELEVVELIQGGVLSDKDIAESLFIAPTTAATHVKRILRKSGLSSRRDLLLLSLSRDR
jgi:DNA-binding CsgD family transcriptional regulator